MKNKKPQNLFFKNGINFVKLFVVTITLLISNTIQAEGTPTVSPNSTNITGLFVAPDLLSGSYLNCAN